MLLCVELDLGGGRPWHSLLARHKSTTRHNILCHAGTTWMPGLATWSDSFFLAVFRLPHYKSATITTENSNTSVGVAFFCVCFSIHTEKFVIFLCVSKIPTEIFENPQKNCVIFLCVSIHTEKLTLFCRFVENAQKKIHTRTRKFYRINQPLRRSEHPALFSSAAPLPSRP